MINIAIARKINKQIALPVLDTNHGGSVAQLGYFDSIEAKKSDSLLSCRSGVRNEMWGVRFEMWIFSYLIPDTPYPTIVPPGPPLLFYI